MRYTTHINILLPLAEMIALFDDAQNRMEWQPELRKMTHLSGEAGQVGAKTAMTFYIMARNSEMVETITVRDLPHRFAAIYEMNGVEQTINNRFEAAAIAILVAMVFDGMDGRIARHDSRCCNN